MDLDLRKLRYFVAVAGRQLLADAGPLLAAAHAVRRRVTEAARGSQRLMVGLRAGIEVNPAVRQFNARHPDVLVDVQRIKWDDQAPMLLDGRIDVGYVRLPIDDASTQPTRRPHPSAGYLARGVDETLEHVASGRGIGIGCGSRGVVTRPVG